MALNIPDPDADRLERVQPRAHAAATSDDLMAVITRGRDRALLDPRSADEVIGYDEDGLPE